MSLADFIHRKGLGSALDLLRDWLCCDFRVGDGGDEVDAEAEAFASVAVAFGADAEALETADAVFDWDTGAGQRPVVFFLVLRQRLELGFLGGKRRIGGLVVETLKTGNRPVLGSGASS